MRDESVRIASHLLSARLRHLSLCGDGRDDGGACKTHEERDMKERLDHLGILGVEGSVFSRSVAKACA